MRLSTRLFRAARTVDTLEVIESGNPRRMARRGKNIALGRTFRRAGAWRFLWK